MAAPALLFNGPLTANFQSSQPLLIEGDRVVLDFVLNIPGPGPVSVQWYPEFTKLNPYDLATPWFRETAEEDLGNGDVRMPLSIRRFSTQGADASLPAGVYYLDAEFRRIHMFCRIRILGLGCTAQVFAPFGEIPNPA